MSGMINGASLFCLWVFIYAIGLPSKSLQGDVTDGSEFGSPWCMAEHRGDATM
jgi:hypothetical protein